MWEEIKTLTWREYVAIVVGAGLVWGFPWYVGALVAALFGGAH